ncbi:Cof-type HAD-IIB family hydrolase [Bacillus songklensis]|uniref:Cof-type HAD-IIB family hydrolase n=1 Tax=Bacillus songklensis TaxID=1069116 RepID=A0ABV8B5K4_9BACI
MLAERKNVKKDFKLIALDMDGTLLDENGKISEANREAIAQAQEKGVHVVLSTGRSIFTCREFAESLKLSSYLVTVNGSEIWDCSGNLLERNILNAEHVQMMWELTNTHKTRFWAVTSEKVWREEFPEDISAQQWLKYGFDIDDNEVRAIILKELSKNAGLEISNSSPTNIEVNAVGINKAKGLRNVCGRLGISMDEVIAMGDSLNDIAMIKEAGCGVAMGNAQDIVKEAADWVTGTNAEDGVAQAIRHWVL